MSDDVTPTARRAPTRSPRTHRGHRRGQSCWSWPPWAPQASRSVARPRPDRTSSSRPPRWSSSRRPSTACRPAMPGRRTWRRPRTLPRPGCRCLIATRAEAVPAAFTASPDLPNTAATASGYRLTAAGMDPAEVATALAAVFGVPGEVAPRRRHLRGRRCRRRQPHASATTRSSPGTSYDPAAGRHGARPSRRSGHVRLASALLSGIGVDVDARRLAGGPIRGPHCRDRLAAGRRGPHSAGLAGRLRCRGDAVMSASGLLGRHSRRCPATRSSARPRPSAGRRCRPGRPSGRSRCSTRPSAEPSDEETASSGSAPVDVSGRPVLRVPMAGIVVTEAELGLAQFWQPDGDLLILPSYLLDGRRRQPMVAHRRDERLRATSSTGRTRRVNPLAD